MTGKARRPRALPPSARDLTLKQRRFIEEYLRDPNATQAAMKAGYSAKTAESIGGENLRKPRIAKILEEREAALVRQRELSQEAVLEAIRRQVLGDIRELFDDDCNFIPIKRLTAAQASMIAGFEIVLKNAEAGDGHTDRVLKLKLKDASKYVEMAGKYFGLFVDRHELSGPGGLPLAFVSKLSTEDLKAQLNARAMKLLGAPLFPDVPTVVEAQS